MPRSHIAPYERGAWKIYAVFLAIPIVCLLLFFVYPVFETLRLSFQSWDGFSPLRREVGLRNYFNLLNDQRFFNSVGNNLRWLLFYLIAPTGLGLGLALLANSVVRGQSFLKIVYFLPYALPPVAVATIWRWLYEPSAGLLTKLLELVGLGMLSRNWLGDPHIVNAALMLSVLWWTTGFAFVVFFAGLRNLPQELLEAARLDGASKLQTFTKVTFPLLWPSTAVVLGMASVDAMRLFDIVWSMTAGGPAYASDVMATQMYDLAFGRLKMGDASAIAVCMFVLSAAFILPFIVYMARRVEFSSND